MSKDMTPQELYHIDRYFKNELRSTEFMFVGSDGTKTPLQSKEERKICEKYKELGFLYSYFYSVYQSLDEYPTQRDTVLNSLEVRLESYVEAGDGDENDPLWLWYIGKLDPRFYYNQRNNEMLEDYIRNEVQKLVANTERSAENV